MNSHPGTREIGTGAAGRRARGRGLRVGLLGVVLWVGASAAWAGDGRFVVEPGGEAGLVRALREGGEAWPAGYALGEIRALPGEVRVAFRGPRGTQATVRALHPSLAPAGALRAGGVALIGADGAPLALVEAVAARLGAEPVVRWRAVGEGGDAAVTAPAGDDAPKAEAAPMDLGQLVTHWEHLVERGEPEAARAELDALDFGRLSGPVERLLVASVYVLAGDRAKAERIAAEVKDPALAPEVAAIARPDVTPGELLGERRGDAACAIVGVAETLRRVGREQAEVPFLRAVLERAPKCAAAAEGLALALIKVGEGEEAVAIATASLKHDPTNAALQMARISALQLTGKLTEAIEGLERLVRSPQRLPGHLGLLLAMYLRERRVQARLDYWMDASAKEPADVVPRFMVGVLLHYENHFAESDTWLLPLFEEMPGEPRLFVYHAMNRFNLGNPAKTRELLDIAAALPVVDPDVYYCRAEVTRDTDRDLAIADFRRYLNIVSGQANTNPVKEARVQQMLASLERCKADGTAVCDGPWEHPRLRGWHAPWVKPVLAGAAAALLATVALVLWRRRRQRTPVAR